MQNDTNSSIVPLSDLSDVQVAEGNPDVRGWKVQTGDGQNVGKVHDLLVDTGAGRVRYLDVELDKKFASRKGQRTLIPIGVAQLDESGDQVIVSGIASSELRTLPPYDGERITREYETTLLQYFGTGTTGATDGDFYSAQHFDDTRFMGGRTGASSGASTRADEQKLTISEEELDIQKRKESAGEVGVRVKVDTEHVQQRVPVSREEVTIERRPIEAGATGTDADISEEEIRVPLSQEELVVDKRVVGKEEIVIKKQTVTEDQIVEADVRRERVDIDEQAGRSSGYRDKAASAYQGQERRRRRNAAYPGPERRMKV